MHFGYFPRSTVAESLLRALELAVAYWIVATFAMVSACSAQETDRTLPFNIPAESLGDALYAYSVATGTEIISDDSLIAGKRSNGINGKYLPEVALRLLLEPTGLAARSVGRGAVALEAAVPVAPMTAVDPYGSYSAALQLALTRALCRYDDTRPGYYRVAARLWIGPSGAVQRSILLDGTGDSKRDASLSRLLNRLRIGSPPPAGMPQPATILVMPLSPRQTGDCVSTENASSSP